MCLHRVRAVIGRLRRSAPGVAAAFWFLLAGAACQSLPQQTGTGQSGAPVAQAPPSSYPRGESPRLEKPTQTIPVTKPVSPPAPSRSSADRAGLPSITARAALLVDQRGRTLYEKNANVRMPVASTQKLLLGILIADSGNLDQRITVTASDTQCEPTKMGIRPGQTYRKGDLLKAVLVRSSNDIARCLARHHSGSVSAFARAMNYKARQLGMYNSYFTNASGLPSPPGQYSTARDLVILGRAAMQRPVIRDAVGTRVMVFRFSDGSTKTLYNTNQVLKGNPFCNGCKTGYTKAAGRCLVSSASDGRRSVMAVILGSKTPNVWSESDALLRYGLRR